MVVVSQHIRPKAFCLALVTSNLLIPATLLIFAWGFFPYKAFLSGSALLTHDQIELTQNAPFDKVILMVVDALRRSGPEIRPSKNLAKVNSDFVFSPQSGFHYTQKSGLAIPFTAHAAAPTITMPRIKAITTGSIPSFLDAILNFAESDKALTLEDHDTWLAQLKAKRDRQLVLLGDDTWLKLFPQTFAYADGTSSFFVSDYTEVDYNVTRNIPAVLQRDEWDGMVLHYLGLDHIGHKMGPSSPHMLPKQAEMDAIVAKIYQALQSTKHLQSTLLVLCGDHGMNDAGNHGGSSGGETSTALVFISPKFGSKFEGSQCPITTSDGSLNYYDKVEQSDIVPTLAGLLGFPIPLNSLGVFISRFLPLWNPEDRIRILQHNAKQILKVVKGTFPNLSFDGQNRSDACEDRFFDGTRLACLWSQLEGSRKGDTTASQEVREAALYTVCFPPRKWGEKLNGCSF
ncbi:MAG: hypothetical protein LQ352_003121 [Teloschistes flavicans]|nr:MAG: hypothetical protein LQ352_003121 [Teloschistes flavicans]